MLAKRVHGLSLEELMVASRSATERGLEARGCRNDAIRLLQAVGEASRMKWETDAVPASEAELGCASSLASASMRDPEQSMVWPDDDLTSSAIEAACVAARSAMRHVRSSNASSAAVAPPDWAEWLLAMASSGIVGGGRRVVRLAQEGDMEEAAKLLSAIVVGI